MISFIKEINDLILRYRQNEYQFDDELAKQLPHITSEAKMFILDFINAWDEAIRNDGLLSYFETTSTVLKQILDTNAKIPGFVQTLLYKHIQHYLFVQNREKDNDWYKAIAESEILDDVAVLRYCYEQCHK